MKKECFVFTSDENKYGSIYKVLLNDIITREDVYYLERTFSSNNKISNLFRKIFFSTVLNIKTKEHLSKTARRLLSNKYELKRIIKQLQDEYQTINIVFFNASIKRYYSAELLREIKQTYKNIKMHLFFMDPSSIWASQNAIEIVENDSSIFENIFTVDSDDAEQKGWIYWATPYSKLDLSDGDLENDLYFCGATKDRHNLLIKLIEYFKSHSIKNKMDVFYIKRKEYGLNDLKQYIDVKSIKYLKEYNKTLEEMNKSNCILELVTPEQSATFTLRDYEAVVYNKKLLTNNKSIKDFPNYNEEYMQYFRDVDEIDIEWLKQKEIVDYKYKGEYSPVRLIEEISRSNENK